MQFIDTTTPKSAQEYINAGKNYAGISDMSRELATNWATMYYQNAYNTALQNYMNDYNSPRAQMLRYQEAGINPYGANIEGGNMSSTHPGAAPKGNFTAPSNLEKIKAGLQAVDTVSQAVKSATDIYDYISYGAPTHFANYNVARYNADAAGFLARSRAADAAWAEYWNYGPEHFRDDEGNPYSTTVENSPRARYMETTTDYKASQINQIRAMIDILYPSQSDRNSASAALDKYRLEVLKGQNDAILQINTGNSTADGILKMIIYKVMDTSIGVKF